MKKVFSLLLLLSSLSSIWAQKGGNSAFSFLNIPTNARSITSGGQLPALKTNTINHVTDNPALIDSLLTDQLHASYINYVADINIGDIKLGFYSKKLKTVVAELKYFNYGTFDETDLSGNKIGEFTAGDYQLSFSTSRKITEKLNYGLSFKNIFSDYYNAFGYGISLDGGLYYQMDSYTSMGLVLKNIGYQIVNYSTQNDGFTNINLNWGLSRKIENAPFRLNLLIHDLQKWDLTLADEDTPTKIDPITKEASERIFTVDKLVRHFALGTEFLPSKNFNLRLAFDYQQRQAMSLAQKPGLTGFSMGFGLKLKRMWLEYGLGRYHNAGTSSVFSIVLNLNDF